MGRIEAITGTILLIVLVLAKVYIESDVDVNGSWRPTLSPGHHAVPSSAFPDGAILTFHADGTWSAADGCGRRTWGVFVVAGDELSLSVGREAGSAARPITGCVPSTIDYLALLGTVVTVSRTGDQSLEMRDKEGRTVVEFAAVSL